MCAWDAGTVVTQWSHRVQGSCDPPQSCDPPTHPTPSSGSRDTTLMVWDPVSGVAISTCRGHAYQVRREQ